MNTKQLLRVLFISAALLASTHAADRHVDNVKGNDETGDGSANQPFRTIARALKHAATSDAVYLTPNAEPYNEDVDLPVGGTPEQPFIFDGRGSVINRLTHYGADKWKDEGSGVFSMPLPNNAHVMDGQWRGFDLVFFDGKAGKNGASREDLSELGYFLFKRRLPVDGKHHPLHNTLYIKLPEGVSPADIKIEAPGISQAIFHCGRSHVIIRNLTAMYGTCDGFDTTRAQGIVIEGVRGCYNMDQGLSNHGAEVIVRNSRFDHNAGGGIVDVFDGTKVRYEHCLIEYDTYRVGVEFHEGGSFVMEDCVIRFNSSSALTMNSPPAPSTQATLRNCLLIGPSDESALGIVVNAGELTLENCTFYRFQTGLTLTSGTLTMTNCAFIDCEQNYNIVKPVGEDTQNITMDFNVFEPNPFTVHGTNYAPQQWEDLQTKTGWNPNSVLRAIADPRAPWSLPSLKDKNGNHIGARLDPEAFRFLGAAN